ncbi:hypothetical protein THIARS_60982 [Thiomonas delicata]|uniref:Uncharacterized protein n=1 Tax=Thiomonas delicata TaxID=364030 RepID=A0A238D4X7_THIDL|nr:hypothetical protein THIARS_60982 [Thiomonas delicata]
MPHLELPAAQQPLQRLQPHARAPADLELTKALSNARRDGLDGTTQILRDDPPQSSMKRLPSSFDALPAGVPAPFGRTGGS